MLIGGLQSHIVARYVNGQVNGTVSCQLSSKKFSFSFDPLKSL